MSDTKAENKSENSAVVENEIINKDERQEEKTVTKGKRSGTKRLSTLEKTTQEADVILKGLNSTGPEVEGRRRTRSSARGITVLPVPSPAKKEKKEPKNTGGRGRGRPKKNNDNDEENPTTNSNITNYKDEDAKMEVDKSNDEKVDTKSSDKKKDSNGNAKKQDKKDGAPAYSNDEVVSQSENNVIEAKNNTIEESSTLVTNKDEVKYNSNSRTEMLNKTDAPSTETTSVIENVNNTGILGASDQKE